MHTITKGCWSVWQPTAKSPWNLQRVAHLHRRAGFAANWNTLQRDLSEGHENAIHRLLQGELDTIVARQDFESLSKVICDAAVSATDINRLKAWWLYRMMTTSDPLHERLTVMWHNHFATSNVKVADVALMRQQNDTLRRFAKESFETLFTNVTKDPALLIWLDADANRKEHPNENLAREIMELFSLGEGNYTEKDIKEAARALTGWTVRNGKFRVNDRHHDAGEKTIFGNKGSFDGDDLVKLLLEHPATPERIAIRICQMLLGDGIATDEQVKSLSNDLREHDLDVMWAVEKVIRSETFFGSSIKACVISPIEFVIGAIRALEITDPPPSTLVLAETTSNLGQSLFEPPNVFGWPGGRSWLTSRTLIARANFAASLIRGELHGLRKPFDAMALARKHGFAKQNEVESFYAQLLLGQEKLPEQFEEFSTDANRLVIALLSSAEMQIA